VLTGEDVDAREEVPEVGTDVGALLDREELRPAYAFAYRLGLALGEGEGKTEEGVALRVFGRAGELRPELLYRLGR
jgi:hypothetical protein